MGFDPVATYMGHLQQRFGHLGLFCAGLCGSCTIAVRWLPQVRQQICSGSASPGSRAAAACTARPELTMTLPLTACQSFQRLARSLHSCM